MSKGRNTHAPYMTFTALNHWTVLLLDITHIIMLSDSDSDVNC